MNAEVDASWQARRSLRCWALFDLIYALCLAIVVVFFVPWKWLLAHVMVLTYLLAHCVSAPGLWRMQRWGWRCAVATSCVGLAFAIVGVTGLLVSWAYLKSVYGTFGKGASLVSLLLATTLFQALGLYPGLRLNALLRRNVRDQVNGGRLAAATIGTALGLSLGLTLGLYNHYRMVRDEAAPTPLAEAGLRWLRASFGSSTLSPPAILQARLPHGPLTVTLYHHGQVVARAHGHGNTWAEALNRIRSQLVVNSTLPQQLHARLKLDRPMGFAPVPSWPAAAEAIGFEPAKDGLRVRSGNGVRMLLPDDMIAADVYGSAPLLPFLEEVRLGVSPTWVRQQLAARAQDRLERFAVESWIECSTEDRRVCKVERGVVQLPMVRTKQAAIDAGLFMLRHQKPDGRFTYVYRPWQNQDQPAGYNLARHAGTAYTLAVLAPLAPDAGFAAGSSRALQWLMAHAAAVCGGQLCLREADVAKVGNNALTLLALLTYQQSSQDQSWATSITALARFLLSLQKPSGDLVPAYSIAQQHAADAMPAQMFASEEAAFALATAGRVLGDSSLLQAAARLVTYLTTQKYDHFLGRFSYGADSWTCMAAASLPRALVQSHWVDFCLGYADFLARMQFKLGDHDAAFVGHYGFSHVLVPQAPAAAGFAEALTATLQLARDHQRPSAALQMQVVAALEALKRDQLRPGNDYLAAAPEQAWGGIRRSVAQSDIRIDFVQHAAAALAHGSSLGL